MLRLLWALLVHDIRLSLRRQAEVVAMLFFFVLVASLFPLGVGPDADSLRRLGPGVLWVTALLASMLALPRLFADDFRDGTLEQLLLAPCSLTALVMTKILAHWLLTGLPLAIVAPLLGALFDLSGDGLLALGLSVLLGSLALSGIGALGAALTLGARGGSVLVALLVLPLYVPVLIFGSNAVVIAMSGLPVTGILAILAG